VERFSEQNFEAMPAYDTDEHKLTAKSKAFAYIKLISF